jgi:hypothetical protein
MSYFYGNKKQGDVLFMIKELPFNTQAAKMKSIITQLIQTYQTDTFEFQDIINRVHRADLYEINFDKVFNYLSNLGEIEIDENRGLVGGIGSTNCDYLVFRVTEKFGKLPAISVSIPITKSITDIEPEIDNMMSIYGILAVFETNLRRFIVKTLDREKSGWWNTSYPLYNTIQVRKADPRRRWHIESPRHDIQYAYLRDLSKIIDDNWDVFSNIFGKDDKHVILGLLRLIEVPRNTISHSNVLSKSQQDMLKLHTERIASFFR